MSRAGVDSPVSSVRPSVQRLVFVFSIPIFMSFRCVSDSYVYMLVYNKYDLSGTNVGEQSSVRRYYRKQVKDANPSSSSEKPSPTPHKANEHGCRRSSRFTFACWSLQSIPLQHAKDPPKCRSQCTYWL